MEDFEEWKIAGQVLLLTEPNTVKDKGNRDK